MSYWTVYQKQICVLFIDRKILFFVPIPRGKLCFSFFPSDLLALLTQPVVNECHLIPLCRFSVTVNQVASIAKTQMFLISSCSCLCPIHWSQVLCREWRCSWNSTTGNDPNYIWVIINFITYKGATYIRGLKVYHFSYSLITVVPVLHISSWIYQHCVCRWSGTWCQSICRHNVDYITDTTFYTYINTFPAIPTQQTTLFKMISRNSPAYNGLTGLPKWVSFIRLCWIILQQQWGSGRN